MSSLTRNCLDDRGGAESRPFLGGRVDRPNIPGSLTVDKSKLTGLHGVELVFSTVRQHRWYWGDIWKDCVTNVLEHSICRWIVTFPSGTVPELNSSVFSKCRSQAVVLSHHVLGTALILHGKFQIKCRLY